MGLMSQHTAKSASGHGATPEKQALLDAFDTVLKHQAEVREAEARAAAAERLRARARPVIWISGALTLVLCAYLMVERPEWLFPQPIPPESTAVQEASLRIAMANAAQHVNRYRSQQHRLPETLSEAGAHAEGVNYQRIGDTGWRMTASHGTSQLSLGSEDGLAGFVGRSFEIIGRRGQ
jgi:hypothetical protein